MRWFVVENNKIINVVVYSGGGGWNPPRGTYTISTEDCPDGCDIGWEFKDGEWIAPVIETIKNEIGE